MYRTIVLAAFASSAVVTAAADPVLEMMRSVSSEGPIYAYEMTYAGEDVVAAGKVDPSQPEGQRIELYSPSEEDLPKDFKDGLKEMDAGADGDIWCTEFAQMVPANATQTGQDETSVTYVFTPQPGEDADKNERKVIKQLNGTVTLDKSDGAVLAYNMVLPKPYKPVMVAKINRFELDATCNRAPDGRTYVEQFKFDIAGSAMMQNFDETVIQGITKLLDPVG